jgi:hypothetical protein
MAIKFPDILQHNNSAYALMNATELRGTSYPLAQLTDVSTIPEDKRALGTIVFLSTTQEYYGYYGTTTTAGDWTNTTTNWKALASGISSLAGYITTGSATATQAITGSLTLSGSFKIDIPSKATNYVLTSDANGNATWASAQQASSIGFITTGSSTAIQAITGSLIISGSGLAVTGSLRVSGSTFINLGTSASVTNVVMINPTTGQLYYTASSAISTVTSTAGLITTGSSTATQTITGSLTVSGSGLTVTGSIRVSGSTFFNLGTSASVNNVVMINPTTGQLYYTASSAIQTAQNPTYLIYTGSVTASVGVGTASFQVVSGSSNFMFISSSGRVGIGTTTPAVTLDVSGSAQISSHLKIGDIPFATWVTTTGSRLNVIDYTHNPTVHPEESMARSARSIYGSSSFTDFSANRYNIVGYQRNLELAPGQTYNIASLNWNALKASLGAYIGIGVSGSSPGPATTYNSGYTLNSTNYGIVAGVDFWPEFDQGTLVKQYNGQYAAHGGVIDLWGGVGTTVETLMYYTAGGFKSLVNSTASNVYNYYSTIETESFAASVINNIYGFYSAPLSRSYTTRAYGFYQSGSTDLNYFQGKVGIGISPSASLHVAGTVMVTGSLSITGSSILSGSVYMPMLTTGSNTTNLVLWDTAGQLYYTSSNLLTPNLQAVTNVGSSSTKPITVDSVYVKPGANYTSDWVGGLTYGGDGVTTAYGLLKLREDSAGTGDVATLKSEALNAPRTIGLPNANGTLIISINNTYTADGNGNVTLPAGNSYIAGPGISIGANNAISSSILTVNGVGPTNGNIATSLTAVTTGTSQSLFQSSSGTITGSLTNGLVWIVANDPTPANNGDAYIFAASGSTPGVSTGSWYPLSPLDTAAADARYLKLNADNDPMTGELNMGNNSIVNIKKLGVGTLTPTAALEIIDSSSFVYQPTPTAGVIIGRQGSGSTFLVHTPSLNTTYGSGFVITGSYAGTKADVILNAFGPYSAGGYNADMVFKTSYEQTLTEVLRLSTSESNPRIVASAKVGIGTSTPQDALQVYGDISLRSGSSASTNYGMIKFGTSDPNNLSHYAGIASNGYGSSIAKANLMFYTDGGTGPTEKMRIYGGGAVVIGNTVTNGFKLEIDAVAVAPGSALRIYQDNTNTIDKFGTGSHIHLDNPNSLGTTAITSYINGGFRGKILNTYEGDYHYVVSGSGDHYFWTQGYQDTGSVRLFVSASGNVGIGNNFLDPKQTLTVSGSVGIIGLTTASSTLTNVLMISSSGQLFITASSAIGGGGTTTPSYLIYTGSVTASVNVGTGNIFTITSGSSPTTFMVVSSSGNVGIGTTTPTYPFVVASSASINGIIFDKDGSNTRIFNAGTLQYQSNEANTQHYFRNFIGTAFGGTSTATLVHMQAYSNGGNTGSAGAAILTLLGDRGVESARFRTDGLTRLGMYYQSSSLSVTGSTVISGSTSIIGLTTSPTTLTNVLMVSSSGQLYITASSAFGGGSGPVNYTGLITTGSSGAYQTITGSLNVSSSLYINTALLTQQENLTVNTSGYKTIVSVATGSARAAFFDFVMYSGSNARAGTVMSIWSASVVEYTEASTNDIGNTSGVLLVPSISGQNILLQASASSNSWTIKSLVRLL